MSLRDPTDLGPSIVGGVVLRHSASGLESADDRPGEGGCPRKWFYDKVDPAGKLRRKASHAAEKDAGTAMHDSFKNYLRTGNGALLNADATRAHHLLPPPGPDLRTELSLHEVVHTPAGPVARSPLELCGAPYVGYMDLVHERGINYGGDDENYGGDQASLIDPPGTIEVLDFKRKKTPTSKRTGISLVPHPNDLRHKIQMAGYGMWAFRAARASFVRLSHLIVFADSTPPRKVTKLHVLEDLLPTWEYAGVLARVVTDAARQDSPDRVPFNKASCDAYGGCPHREFCRGYKETSLASRGVLSEGDLVGLVEQMQAIQQQQATGAPTQTFAPTNVAPPGGASAGFPSVVSGPQMPMTFPPPHAMPGVTVQHTPWGMVAAPDPAIPTGAAESARAALEAEETRLRAQAVQTQAQAAPSVPVAPPPEAPILGKFRLIASANMGSPAMAGEVAQAYASAVGVQLGPNAGMAGTGAYGSMTLYALAQVDQFIDMMRQSGALPPAPPAPPAPPVGGILPPDAPASRPELATAGEPKPGSAPEGEKPKKRGPGRPKKNQDAAPTAANTIAPSSDEDALDAFFVDCAPNFACESLDAYFDAVCDVLVKNYCLTAEGKPDVQDIRAAPNDGKLGYGRWKGALAEMIAATPLPAGSWTFKTYGDEMRQVAADAYRRVATARGALYVRGAS